VEREQEERNSETKRKEIASEKKETQLKKMRDKIRCLRWLAELT
jgi:hypothetical protein